MRFPRGRLGSLPWRGALLASAALGCNTRDRLTFPDPGPAGAGPHTIIDHPLGDTVVSGNSANLFVTGWSVDHDGLDTVYYETVGGLTSFQPDVVGSDSFRFGLPLTIGGLAGDTILLRVFATDRFGNRGDTAIRQIVVQ